MIGDSDDMRRRMVSTFPHRWTQHDAPNRNAILGGLADALAYVYGLLAYAKDQTRIRTASGMWLDLIAFDFFGLRVRRRQGQTDDAMQAMIMREIFRARVTRAGLKGAVADLTGNDVRIIEPWNTVDCGGYDTGLAGFDMCGRWGSLEMPCQLFLATLQPIGAGIPNVGGFDNGPGGFDAGAEEYGDQSMVVGPVTDQDIYDTINATRAAGITVWTAIGYPPEARLDVDFVLDQSELY